MGVPFTWATEDFLLIPEFLSLSLHLQAVPLTHQGNPEWSSSNCLASRGRRKPDSCRLVSESAFYLQAHLCHTAVPTTAFPTGLGLSPSVTTGLSTEHHWWKCYLEGDQLSPWSIVSFARLWEGDYSHSPFHLCLPWNKHLLKLWTASRH